jgi:hypothetical protein
MTYTPGPWIGFTDQGKVIAIMPAMREGDICTFEQSPSDADASLLIAAPALAKALEEIAEGKGRFSTDRYEHACNTIEDMKQLARDALALFSHAQRGATE